MDHVVLVIHLILTLALIVLILIQRSEGGGLGMGSSGGGMGNFASAQSTANALTKATTFVAICFFTTSLILAIMASRGGISSSKSILDDVDNPPAVSSSAIPAGAKTGINSESAPVKPTDVLKQSGPDPKKVIPAPKPKSAPVVPTAE